MTTTIALGRRTAVFLSAGVLAATGTALLVSGWDASATPGGSHQVWVCKYIHKPGGGEVLKAGKNPILVDWAALTGKAGAPHVGDAFSDRHTNSVVVQIGGVDPGTAACPGAVAPTTPSESGPATSTSPSTTTSLSTTTAPSTTVPATPSASTSMGPTSVPATPSASTSMGPAPVATSAPGRTLTPSTTRHVGPVPGTGAPGTGGEGDANPVNGLVGSALLMSAAGVVGAGALRRRRDAAR